MCSIVWPMSASLLWRNAEDDFAELFRFRPLLYNTLGLPANLGVAFGRRRTRRCGQAFVSRAALFIVGLTLVIAKRCEPAHDSRLTLGCIYLHWLVPFMCCGWDCLSGKSPMYAETYAANRARSYLTARSCSRLTARPAWIVPSLFSHESEWLYAESLVVGPQQTCLAPPRFETEGSSVPMTCSEGQRCISSDSSIPVSIWPVVGVLFSDTQH